MISKQQQEQQKKQERQNKKLRQTTSESIAFGDFVISNTINHCLY